MLGLLWVHPDYENRPRVRDAARILKGEAPLPSLPARKPRVRIRPVLPNDTEEILNVVGDRPSIDDAPYFSPRSQFNNIQLQLATKKKDLVSVTGLCSRHLNSKTIQLNFMMIPFLTT